MDQPQAHGRCPRALSRAGPTSALTATAALARHKGDKPHHYIFTVYAVDEDKLQFAKDHNVSAAVVGFELHFHSKAKGVLTATYSR